MPSSLPHSIPSLNVASVDLCHLVLRFVEALDGLPSDPTDLTVDQLREARAVLAEIATALTIVLEAVRHRSIH